MRVTPLDIIQKQFAPARRGGVESDEVREFLDQIRESMEALLKENQGLRDEVGRKDAEIAEQNRLVGVSLIESAGADLPNQDKIFVHGGAGFRSLTQRSEQRIPTVCLVFGSSTAGGAYLPGMSDYVVMVKEQAQVYLAGPPLVKMATGEETGHEELGGAQMHSSISGVSDYLAEDELDALRLGREIVAHLDWRKPARPTPRPVEAPVHDPEDLLGIASADIKTPFDQREVIARIVDGSDTVANIS